MALINYPVVMELDPTRASAVVNKSTRGWVGTGERIMISGFVVEGRTPRNILVRVLGSSLAQFGITEPLADPRIEIFHGSEKIAENNNWLDGNFAPRPGIPEQFPSSFAWLFPTHEAEAALHLSLLPGAYTIHVSGVGGTTGIALAEVYDLDALVPP